MELCVKTLMSRAPINAAVSEIGKKMDVMTIDPSCLRIPYRSKKTNTLSPSPTTHYPVISLLHEHQQQASGDVSIELIADPSTEQTLFSVPGWFIFVGYLLFSLSLALCNLFINSSATSPVCIIASPVAMLSFLAHAFSIQPLYMGAGLLGSAWLLPIMCAMWSVDLSLNYIAFVGISLALASWRVSSLVIIVILVAFLFLSSPSMVIYHGVDSHWGISVSVFLVTLLGVLSSRHLARVTFKLKPLL